MIEVEGKCSQKSDHASSRQCRLGVIGCRCKSPKRKKCDIVRAWLPNFLIFCGYAYMYLYVCMYVRTVCKYVNSE